MKKILLILILFSANLFAITGNEILQKVDKNLAPRDNEIYRKIINKERSGRVKEFVLYSAKKGDEKILSAFLAPASDKGRTTLRIGDNMWMYVPVIGKPIRIASLESVIGGLFNNSDILKVDFTKEYEAKILEENKNQYVIELKAKTKTVAYDKIKMWVTKKNMLPTKYEAYTHSGLLVKKIILSDIKDFGNGIIRPSLMTTTSPFEKGAESKMIFLKLKPKKFPNEMFSISAMSKLNLK